MQRSQGNFQISEPSEYSEFSECNSIFSEESVSPMNFKNKKFSFKRKAFSETTTSILSHV